MILFEGVVFEIKVLYIIKKGSYATFFYLFASFLVIKIAIFVSGL